MDEEAWDEAAAPKKGTDDNDDNGSTPAGASDATPEDESEDDNRAKVEAVVVRLTRVPKWKRELFLMRERKSLMSHSWQSRMLMSHQPFIISRE